MVERKSPAKPSKETEGKFPPDGQALEQLTEELKAQADQLEAQNQELRESQTELQAARNRYRRLYELAPVAYLTLDRGWRIVEANAAAEALLGVPRRSLGKTPLIGFVMRGSRLAFRDHFQAALKSDATQICELQMLRRGAPFFACLQTTRTTEDGKLVFLMAAEDITERKRAEARLRASEAKYRDIVETAGEGIWLTDAESRTVFVNKQMADMLGYTVDEMMGKPFYDFISSEDRTPSKLRQAARDQGVGEQYEFKFPRKGGGEVWTIISGAPLRDAEGHYTGNLGMITDITGRKRTEAELRKLSGAVEQSPATVIITDLQGNIQYANPRFEETTGYAVAEALGKNPRIMKSGQTPPEVYKDLWTTIKSGKVWRGEFLNRKKNGEPYWESAAIAPIRNEQGAITHFVAVKEDITERKRLGVERERLLQENQRRAAELEAVIQSIADPVVIYNVDGSVALCNPGVEALYGFDPMGMTREQIVQKLTVRHMDGPPVTLEEVPSSHALRGETVRSRPFKITNPQGRELTVLVSAAPLRDPTSGSIIGAVVVWHDITELERLREEDRRRAAELIAVTESTQAHLALLDRDMNFVMVNSTYAQGSGHAEAELIGRNHFELFPDAENQAIFERVRDTGEPFQICEKPFEYADQPWRGVTYWDWTLTPVKGKRGDVEGLVLSLFDVTAQVRARQRIELLASVAMGVNAGHSLDDIMHSTLGALVKLLRADDYSLYLFDGDGKRLTLAYELRPGTRDWRVFNIDDRPATRRAVEARQTIYLPLPQARGAAARRYKKLGIWGMIASPLMLGDRCAGVLYIHYAHPGYEPPTEDLALVEAFAGQCALTVDHFRTRDEADRERARLKAVVEQMPVGVIVAEAPEGRTLLANRFASESMEQRAGFHLDGRPYQPEEWPLARSLRSGEVVVSEEVQLRRPDGSRGNLLVSSGPIYDEAGRLSAAVAAFHDITERRQMEEKYTTVLRTSLDGFWIVDTKGRLREVNEAYCRMTGYSRDELLAMTVADVEASESPEEVREHIRKVMESGWDRFETRHWRKDGRLINIEISVGFLSGGSEAEGRFFVFLHDITERHAAERKILELYADLERRARGLEALNKELEAFTYSVSHDLRTPLRAMDGFSQALLDDYATNLDERGKDYLQRVRRASQRMGQLIDDLLQLSRVTRAEMHASRVDLSALATEVAEDLKKTQPERQVEFAITPGLVARGDARLLRIVLENLMGNAWKFTSKHPSARIEFGATEQGGETAYFVRDDGCGFDMAFVDKMFGAFQRLHGIDEFGGTGIGLATVQRIITRHGGRVWAEGALEKGATVYFTL
ncbi:MAG: PAS domain S-box protein [Chloroflexi bacterium]|nr:PAS domain S-box protein [Chloroflexota bacterium]